MLRDELAGAVRRLSGEASLASAPTDGSNLSPLQWAKQAQLDDATIARSIGETMGLAFITDLADRSPSAEFLEKVPIAFARQHGMLGLANDEGDVHGNLPVAVASVEALRQLHVVARYMGRSVTPVLAPAADVTAAINAAYQQRTGAAQTFIEKLDRNDVLEELEQLKNAEGREDLLDVSSRAPVIKLVNLILFEAVQSRASDVHIQPYENSLVARLRIDGVLYDSFTIPKSLQEEVISRIKVMGRMNIAEKRLAQDGRTSVQVGDRSVDLRIASLPTSFGERVVIRLLDKRARLYTLQELGMDLVTVESFRHLINLEHGLILVTGPTGSGKSTTLYAALREIDHLRKNVLTLEDPIEFQLEGISQTQVSDKKGMTFASGLRSVLRQDPDVIMVGEIRDRETALMAIQSALTGHLVFSTLHTNDASSAITRLLDLGIEPYLIASSVIAVLAQRLVRQVCTQCAKPFEPSAADWRRMGLGISPGVEMRMGTGCKACRNTGYSGRVGIFELLRVTEPIQAKIQTRATAADIQAAAKDMKTLRDDGVVKALAGLTTVDEVVRVTMKSGG